MMRFQKSVVATTLLLGFATILFAAYSFGEVTVSGPVEEPTAALPVIIIDAGHGGFDPGAVGVGGVAEKDINLSIAQKLYDLFTVSGFDAVLTRDSDEALDDADAKTVRKRKNTDIHNRFELAKAYPNSILLSIHQNKFTRSKYFGAQIFYGTKNERSAAFAQVMQRRFIEMLQPENTRVSKPCGNSVYLIDNAPMPALLVECGFLSNPADAEKLVTGEYQKNIAFAIFASTVEYLGLEAVGTGEAV